MKVTGKIAGKSINEGNTNGNNWRRCTFEIDGKKYSTFDEKTINEVNIGDMVEMEIKQEGVYRNIVSANKVKAELTTANQVTSQDPNIWVQKDLRQARMSGLKNASTMIDVMSRIDQELLKKQIGEAGSIVIFAEDMAKEFIDFIYGDEEEYPKVDAEYQDY